MPVDLSNSPVITAFDVMFRFVEVATLPPRSSVPTPTVFDPKIPISCELPVTVAPEVEEFAVRA